MKKRRGQEKKTLVKKNRRCGKGGLRHGDRIYVGSEGKKWSLDPDGTEKKVPGGVSPWWKSEITESRGGGVGGLQTEIGGLKNQGGNSVQ